MVLWTRVSITSEVRRRTKGSCSEGGLHGMELQFSSHGTIHILRKHIFRIFRPPPPGPTLWQYGLWSFQTGGTKLDRFLPKNPQFSKETIEF